MAMRVMDDPSKNIPTQTPCTILIIDDELSILKATSIMLKDQGYNVFDTYDPFHAATIFTSYRIDAAIIDVCMPGIDGIQFAEMIQSISPETAILLMSAHAESPPAQKAQKMFGENFLNKSQLQDTLLKRVDAVLRRCATSDDTMHPV